MSHECEICGQECFCDMEDCGGFPQPANCEHFRHHKETGGDGEYDIGLDLDDVLDFPDHDENGKYIWPEWMTK